MNEIFKTVEQARTTEEVKNMVRKAETLKNFEELNVSKRTLNYLKKNFASASDAIKYGRCSAYNNDTTTSISKWESELVSVLKEAGFIRPKTDFTKSFCIGSLYAAIFPDNKDSIFWDINQLSNEQYESFESISDKDIENVINLCHQLQYKDCEVISLRYGLDDGERQSPQSVAKRLQTTTSDIHRTEDTALKILRNRNNLPTLFKASSKSINDINNLISELDKLHEDPVFEKEHKLLKELENKTRPPFKYTAEINEFLKPTPIKEMDLALRTYNCLLRAGINTVSDILRYPRDAWHKIRNLGRYSLEEIIDKMHLAGYENFSVDTPIHP